MLAVPLFAADYASFVCLRAAAGEIVSNRLSDCRFSCDDAGSLRGIPPGAKGIGLYGSKNISIEYRYSEKKIEQLPNMAAELVRLNADIIVSGGPTRTG